MALTTQEAVAVLDQPLDVNDVAFIGALRAGHRDAFERLVAEYQTQLHSLALRIVQNREDARDVVQEVFIKAFRALPETHGRLHLRAWLYRITINASYDHLRACKRRPLPVVDEELERPSTVDDTEQADLVRMFTQTLRSLPPRQQVALLLKDVHGLPHSEIAEALGITRGSSEVLLFRARSGFRRTFTALNDVTPSTPSTPHCGFAERQAARAVGGGLPPARRRQLLEHARNCPDCRRTLEGIGGAALGLAVALPLVAMSGGTAAAAGLVSTAAAGAAAGLSGATCAAGTLGAGVAASGATTAGAALGGAGGLAASGGSAIAGGIVAKLGALASVKAATAVAGVCVVAAGGVAGVEIAKQQPHHDAGRAAVGAPAPTAPVAPACEGGTAVVTDQGAEAAAASPTAVPSNAASASPTAVATPTDTASPTSSANVAIEAVSATSQTTIAAILNDAADGTLDGNWSRADVEAALASLSPLDRQYSYAEEILEACLAGDTGPGNDNGSELPPTGADVQDQATPIITPSATAQTAEHE